jgi:ABC-type branched-subunit amino acid transport system substrate-binding protein
MLVALAVLAGCSTVLDRLAPAQQPVPYVPAQQGQAEAPVAGQPVPPPVAPSVTPPVIGGEAQAAMPVVPPPAGAIQPPSSADEIRIGLLLPLSGPDATLGQALLNAALLALFDQNDQRITLLPQDTKATPDFAEAAAKAALDRGAKLLIGPLYSASTAAVRPIAEARGVKVFSFSNDRAAGGRGVYLMGFSPEQEIARVVDYARRKGLKRFAALAPDDAYGRTAVDALQRMLVESGGQIVRQQRYAPDAKGRDLSESVSRLIMPDVKKLDAKPTPGPLAFDALLLADGGARLRAVAPWLAYNNLDPNRVRVLGTGLWDESGLGREPALVGGWFAQSPIDSQVTFQSRFAAIYGANPPRRASLGYDAVAVAAKLAQRSSGQFDASAIEDPKGFSGYDGIFRFHTDGRVERGLAIAQIEPRGNTMIDPAPSGF